MLNVFAKGKSYNIQIMHTTDDDSRNNFSDLSVFPFFKYSTYPIFKLFTPDEQRESSYNTSLIYYSKETSLPCLYLACLSCLSEGVLNWKTAHSPPTQAVRVKIYLDSLSGKLARYMWTFCNAINWYIVLADWKPPLILICYTL